MVIALLQLFGFLFCRFCDMPYFVKHVQLTANLKDILERVNKNISIPIPSVSLDFFSFSQRAALILFPHFDGN